MEVVSIGLRKGGVGKTTTAYNLAYRLSQNHNVTIYDLDRSKQSTKINSVHNKLNVVSIDTKEELKKSLSNSKDDYCIIDLGGFDSELQRWAMS